MPPLFLGGSRGLKKDVCFGAKAGVLLSALDSLDFRSSLKHGLQIEARGVEDCLLSTKMEPVPDTNLARSALRQIFVVDEEVELENAMVCWMKNSTSCRSL